MDDSREQNMDTPMQDCVPFNSHCARETPETRLQETGPERLTIKELKAELGKARITFHSGAKKAELVHLFLGTKDMQKPAAFVTPEAAASEKAASGESLAVEHVAELAPGQARKARLRALDFSNEDSTIPDSSASCSTVEKASPRKRQATKMVASASRTKRPRINSDSK
jgi:hypothetical protein